jgi:hypothetical protein
MSALGDTAPKILQQNLPNDGVALYGSRAKFRLRVYTSGGMTPNGVSALLPTDYDRYFAVNAVTASGRTVRLTRSGKTYNPGGPGNNPAPGVHYSAPSPPITEPVTIALRNPLTVTYIHCPHQPPRWSLPARCVNP